MLAYWTLQRIAFQTRSWFAVGTSQLASNAATRVLPGGAAAASALQYGMLVRAGLPPQNVASGVAASWAATTATVLALPPSPWSPGSVALRSRTGCETSLTSVPARSSS